MSFTEWLKNIFSNTISDEEVENTNWVLCPKCHVNIDVEDVKQNRYYCPNCSNQIPKDLLQ